MITRFQLAAQKKNEGRPPVWFMRQAGRYHSHYQKLKETYSFTELCKLPKVACEATMGPIRDFDFDAAILFSDLLFPLEAMGMGLKYEPGPKLDWHLSAPSELGRLEGGAALAQHMTFQADAMRLIRQELPREKSLLGFVGGPLTLFCYAVEGSHAGELESSKAGLKDGRFEGFTDKLHDLLVANMLLQARAGADTVAILDTCAGEFAPQIFQETVLPRLTRVMKEFKAQAPETALVYYSKGSSQEHWRTLMDLPFDVMGIDWRTPIAEVLDSEFGERFAIQGNVDPSWLFLEPSEFESRLRDVFASVKNLPAAKRRGWVCGLGHGVLPKTPESNVRLFLKLQHEIFS